MGKPRVIAETGAGQHGVAAATAAAALGLECQVFMGVGRHRTPGAQRAADGAARNRSRSRCSSGAGTLKDAVIEAMRDWVRTVDTTHYIIGRASVPILSRGWCASFRR